jgi:subtilase family serine protease
MFTTRGRVVGVVAAVIVVLTALVAALLLGRPAVHAQETGFTSHTIRVTPKYQETKILSSSPKGVTFTCQVVTPPPTCYQPAQIRAAYGIQSLLDHGITGKGKTIVIIDAFQNPYITSDLSIFDSTFGLPAPHFTQIAPFGLTPFDINNADEVGWSGEIALDVQWSHAVAPDANIVLALSKSDQDVDIYNTTKYVIDHNVGDIISQSFGEGESCMDPNLEKAQHELFEEATSKGITLFASSGDNGATQPACSGSGFFLSTSTPASDPLVTAVGGTNLYADPITGAYGSETAWNDVRLTGDPTMGFSGGGFSNIYGRPFYQVGVSGTQPGHRGVPDVAYDAGIDGGVLTHWGVGNILFGFSPTDPTIFFIFGGTSSGSPQWSGLAALADQLAGHRLGFLNGALYRIASLGFFYNASFHDITSGNNNDNGITGYQTAKGWDPVTGLGTPKANSLVPLLVIFTFFGDGAQAEHAGT